MPTNSPLNSVDLGKVALFGASGGVGQVIARELRDRGASYRVVGREYAKLAAAYGNDPQSELMEWNPDDPSSVRTAAEGADTIIYLVGVPYNEFQKHPVIMQQTVDGAVAAGVKRIVLIGTVYAYGHPTTPTVSETHPLNPETFKGKMRKAQEEILLKAHEDGKVQAAILRLPDFYGVEAGEKSFLHLVFKAAVSGGTADMIGPIDKPHEFVYLPDVGPVVLDLAVKPEAYGHWWNLAGAGVTTQQELANAIFAGAGRKPKLRVVGKTVLRLMGLFNPIMKEMVEMHYLLTSPVLMDDTALQNLIGPIKKTSYEDGTRQTYTAYASKKA